MRSQLTRHVLRRFRAHQGVLLPCPIARPSARRYPVFARPSQRRSFLGFFQKAPRILKEPEVEPGFESLLKYGAYVNDNIRPPPKEELINAFREFFKHKKSNHRPINAMEARISHHVMDHLLEPSETNKQLKLTIRDLRTVQHALEFRPRDDPTELVEFSKAVYLQIRKLAPDIKKYDTPQLAVDTASLLRVLTQHERSLEAKDHLMKLWPTFSTQGEMANQRVKELWVPVLRGLADEDKEQELLECLSIVTEQSGFPFIRSFHEIMTTFYARRNDTEKMKHWFYKPIELDNIRETEMTNSESPADNVESDDSESSELLPAQKAYEGALLCAMRNNDQEWAVAQYQRLTDDFESLSRTRYKDMATRLIYRFAVLLLGKGPEHIEQMIMSNPNPDFNPTIEVINSLIEAAMEKDDAYLAERMSALVSKLGLEPDKRLFTLQLEYRTKAGDLDGAFSAYRSLQGFENDIEDWPKLNHLIRNLCNQPVPNHEKVLDVTSYLERLSATLEPSTVVALCMTFLKNDEQYEVIDTLSLHTIHFSWEERALVSKAFVSFCLDKANSTARVWDAYALLRQFFPDTALEDRVKIMDAFFDRKRADMACHVFGHMRQNNNHAYRPTLDIYIRCLEGIGRCPDDESLKMVHNMLKMDTTIQPNTRAYNALMIAYTSCGLNYKALDFWQDIENSIEGPSYQSLEIVFRTYETKPSGDKPAKELWDRLHRMEVDIPPKILTAYAGVLACHSHPEEAKALLEEMEAEVGQRPDVLTLAVVYNALPNDDIKDDFEAWAKQEFPHVWSQLEQKRRRRDAEGMRTFQIERPWES